MLLPPSTVVSVCSAQRWLFLFFRRPPSFPLHPGRRRSLPLSALSRGSPRGSELAAALGPLCFLAALSAVWLPLVSKVLRSHSLNSPLNPSSSPYQEFLFFSMVPADACSFPPKELESVVGDFKQPCEQSFEWSAFASQPRSSTPCMSLLRCLEKIVTTF